MSGERLRTQQDLDVYRMAFEAAMGIFELTKRFPKEETYSLTDQIRRSSRSGCANVAEAWRKRRYAAAFVSKLSDAEAEAAETQVWLEFACRCNYLTAEIARELVVTYDHILGKLVNMMLHPDQWRLPRGDGVTGCLPLSPAPINTMHITYLLLSPTFGMHQYTADLANRMAEAGHDVSLITTSRLPRDRHDARVRIVTPVDNRTTGFGREGLDRGAYRRVVDALAAETTNAPTPAVVHFTGPHLWNVPLLAHLARAGVPTVQTLHDLDPHRGVRFGGLIRVWNRLVLRYAGRVLVHAHTYRERLLARGVAAERVVSAPLLFLFLGSTALSSRPGLADDVTYEPFALFFGRLERYKGVETLLAAAAMLSGLDRSPCRVVLAGAGALDRLWAGALPPQVELLAGHADDARSVDLFRRCRLVVLPYTDASQSAQVAAAYFFRKPVIVTRAGALPEYVAHGRTGYIVEPDHPAGLARRLAELLAAPDRAAALGAAGRAWYDAQHRVEEATLVGMYRDLAVGGGVSPPPTNGRSNPRDLHP